MYAFAQDDLRIWSRLYKIMVENLTLINFTHRMESRRNDTSLTLKLQHWMSDISREVTALKPRPTPKHTTNKLDTALHNMTKKLQQIENIARQPRPTRPSPLLRKLKLQLENLTQEMYNQHKV